MKYYILESVIEPKWKEIWLYDGNIYQWKNISYGKGTRWNIYGKIARWNKKDDEAADLDSGIYHREITKDEAFLEMI